MPSKAHLEQFPVDPIPTSIPFVFDPATLTPVMSLNRRRSPNVLPIARLMFTSVLILMFGGGAAYYVNSKNELHRHGQRIKELEREILAMETRDEVVLSRIAKLSSYEELRKRQSMEKEAFAQLVPVNDTMLVRVQERMGPASNSEVRTVSNLQPVR